METLQPLSGTLTPLTPIDTNTDATPLSPIDGTPINPINETIIDESGSSALSNSQSNDQILAQNIQKISENTRAWVDSGRITQGAGISIKFKSGNELAAIEKELSVIGIEATRTTKSGVLNWDAKIKDEQDLIDLVNSDLVESVHIATAIMIPDLDIAETPEILETDLPVTEPTTDTVEPVIVTAESTDNRRTYLIIAAVILAVGGIIYFNNK